MIDRKKKAHADVILIQHAKSVTGHQLMHFAKQLRTRHSQIDYKHSPPQINTDKSLLFSYRGRVRYSAVVWSCNICEFNWSARHECQKISISFTDTF